MKTAYEEVFECIIENEEYLHEVDLRKLKADIDSLIKKRWK